MECRDVWVCRFAHSKIVLKCVIVVCEIVIDTVVCTLCFCNARVCCACAALYKPIYATSDLVESADYNLLFSVVRRCLHCTRRLGAITTLATTQTNGWKRSILKFAYVRNRFACSECVLIAACGTKLTVGAKCFPIRLVWTKCVFGIKIFVIFYILHYITINIL